MRRPIESRGKPARYALGFTATALLLGGLTLVLVLVVLPRRYVLHAGLRESGVSFPAAAAPFAPPEEQARAAVARPALTTPVPPGPAELFWEEALPLLEQARYEEALPVFEAYLRDRPGDRSIRREHAITLDRAGRRADAAEAYATLLRQRDEPDVRLLYARSLRDQGRLDEAQAQYAALMEAAPDDMGVAMEAARALAWGGRNEAAADILRDVVARHPDEGTARVELARVLYWSGALDEADRLLSALSEAERRRLGAGDLHRDVTAALTPPPAETEPEAAPETTAEAAARVLAGGDVAAAAELYGRAVSEQPEDTALLRTYADVLQYRLEDLEGARAALLALQERRGADPSLTYRLAQLDVWTARNAEAMDRLEALLGMRTAAPPDLDRETSASARVLLGDLYRWRGLRVLSADAYEGALVEDPDVVGARDGLAELRRQVDRQVDEAERPRVGTDVYGFADSDDFRRVDLGVEAVHVEGDWVWGARAGSRIVHGDGVDGVSGSERGIFADVELGRWWRWGTVRTGVQLGMERGVRPGATDATVGASLRLESLAGFRADVRFDHGPAYPLTVTRSSLLLPVRLDRMTVAAARRLGPRWSLSLSADGARLAAKDAAAWPDGSVRRLEAGASLGRSVTDHWTLGVSARALSYDGAAPVSEGRALFWDPESVVALGVYAQLARPLGTAWEVHGRLAPSLAWIDERAPEGTDRVPHLSAEGGFSHMGSRAHTTLDVFYYQGRFDGYRGYGLRLGLAVVDPFRGAGR